MHATWLKNRPFQHVLILFGCTLYAAGINLFVAPLDLYSGGAVGLSQILQILLYRLFPGLPTGINWYGIIYLLLNIPPLIFAWKYMGRSFLLKTLEGIILISIIMALMPIPEKPILDERIASVLVGGVISGWGSGWVLTAGGSGGGLDVIGALAAKFLPDFSVGKLSIYFNAVLFVIFLVMFDPSTALYSLLYMVFYSIYLDRSHYQNINVRLMIFTKKSGVDWDIMRSMTRGVTEWRGVGAYTGKQENVLVTVVNKYEASSILELVHAVDPNAFVVCDDGVSVIGNYPKHL